MVWHGEGLPRLRQKKKAALERLYTEPPPNSVVLCVDEMGPESAQSYPGVEPVRTAPGPDQPAARARQEVDYGRRGKGYIFGAFEPQDGRAFTLPYPGRTTANWVDFLQAVDSWVGPEPEAVFAIVDNLSTHRAADVLLFSLANPRWHFMFQPTYAAYREPDRTLVEDLTAAGAQGPPL